VFYIICQPVDTINAQTGPQIYDIDKQHTTIRYFLNITLNINAAYSLIQTS